MDEIKLIRILDEVMNDPSMADVYWFKPETCNALNNKVMSLVRDFPGMSEKQVVAAAVASRATWLPGV